jgi:outer membrane receptor protein involved in Fe transport
VSYDRVSATYDEQVLAGYLEYDRTFGRAWSVNLGGRYEHTWTKGENKPIANESHTDYGKLFPSLRVGYNPSQSHAFSWSLSSRITRPNIINLNPNKVWRDVNHESYGNQNLKPSYLYKAMMGYTYKGVLSFDLYYTYEPDRIDAVYSVAKQVTITSWDNITDEHSLGINSFYYFDRLRWMNATLMQGVWYSKTVRPEKKTILGMVRPNMHAEVESFSYVGMLQATFFLDRDRKWTASLHATYSSPEKDVTKSLNARYMVDVGLQYRCWKDRLVLGLTCRNLLASHIKGTEYLGTTEMDFDNKFNYRQLRLSLTYNWGARLRHDQRHYESDDMQQRVVNDF